MSRPTPPDLVLTVRRPRFTAPAGASAKPPRWWLPGDVVGSCWHLALSASFPRGEAFFIAAVKPFRTGAPPALRAEIGAFIAQEAHHSRQHIAFNRQAGDAGYDLSRIDRRLAGLLDRSAGQTPIRNLAATIALEHFTAMLARQVLDNPALYAKAAPETVALWRWHAAEEIEHKGVAFDTFLHATREWPAYRRWALRCGVMMGVTRHFLGQRLADTLDLLAQDGITGARATLRLGWWLLARPGLLRRMAPQWLGWFRPGFHPWARDDRALAMPVLNAARQQSGVAAS